MRKIMIVFVLFVLVLTSCNSKTPNENLDDITGEQQTPVEPNTSEQQTPVEPNTSEQQTPAEPNTEVEVVNPEAVKMISYSGLFESVYCEWEYQKGVSSYNVYYKYDNEFIKVDSELVRYYGDYYRVDIVGLKAVKHDIKIVPVVSGVENQELSASFSATPINYLREGFAWVNGESNGAYSSDGTLKENAVVIYVNDNNKDSVKLDVVTSKSGGTTEAIGVQNILLALKKGYETRPLNFRFIGNIKDLSVMDKGDITIDGGGKYTAGLTFEGIGKDATFNGFGIRLKNASNVEIRNLGFMNCDSDEGDNVSLQQDNDHIWVHNCDMFYGAPGKDADQNKGDGTLDCKKSTYVTFSYNHFYDTGKSNLLGLSEGSSDGLFITYHHNWYDHSDSRHPRVRFYSAHVYNNYYDGISKYGVGSTLGSSVFVEGNYFRNCKYPMLISMQGSDVYDSSTGTNDYSDMPTFSKENGGIIKAFNNYMEGQNRFVTYQENNVDFDAYVVENRNDLVPNTVVSAFGANTYNNFDTASNMYIYNAQSPEMAREDVIKYAGRLQGGDFKWEFSEADDSSYDIDRDLSNALKNYSSSLIISSGVDVVLLNTRINTLSEEVKEDKISEIKECYSLYSKLNPSEKEQILNFELLEKCYELALKLEVEIVDSKILLIDLENIDLELVSQIKELYDSLNAEQKENIVNFDILEKALDSTSLGNIVHNFTTDGMTSTFFMIEGNLSDSKGDVVYNEMTLSQCLKMESSTSITFTTKEKMTLTLVFGPKISFKLDGTKYSETGSVYVIEIEAGEHVVTKADTTNLYYIILE